MAVSALSTLTQSTTTILDSEYNKLIRQSEQLRILKNFAALEEVYCKDQITTLIKAMEANNE